MSVCTGLGTDQKQKAWKKVGRKPIVSLWILLFQGYEQWRVPMKAGEMLEHKRRAREERTNNAHFAKEKSGIYAKDCRHSGRPLAFYNFTLGKPLF